MRFTTTHVIPNPNGTFSLAGAVPVHEATCRFTTRPTISQAIGRRIIDTPDGRRGFDYRVFATRDEAEAAVRTALREEELAGDFLAQHAEAR